MADAKLSALTGVSVPAAADLLYLVDVSDTTDDAAGSSRSVTVERLLGLLAGTAGGRLTLETGVPVSTTDQTGKTTLYYTPFVHAQIALYDGTRWKLYQFSEISLALGTLTSGLNYDVFLYDNSGTLALELTAWTNDTTRATALVRQDGVWCKTGALTRRYVGTIRTTATTTTEDSARRRFVFNANHAVPRKLRVREATASWTYATATWREARGQTDNQIEVVVGLAGAAVDLYLRVRVDGDSSNAGDVSIGADSTTTPSSDLEPYYYIGSSNYMTIGGREVFLPAVGYHYYAWLEKAGGGTTTFAGQQYSGLQGVIDA